MNSFKIIGITVSIVFLFVIGISQSQAEFEIEEMYPSIGDYIEYTDSFYHYAYVKTSEPYIVVDWYINGNYAGYSTGDNVKTEATFSPNPYRYPGSLRGKVYTIKAVAYSLYDENEKKHHSDTASYDVTLYEPFIETQTTREKGGGRKGDPHVSGYVKLWRQYFDGSVISINCSAYAYNSRKNSDSVEAYGVFRHTILNKPFDERETFMPSLEIAPGESYGPYVSGDLSFPCTHIEKGDRWDSDAYIRLKINGRLPDDYFIGNVIKFTSEDNPTN